jgi:hypothetical protein
LEEMPNKARIKFFLTNDITGKRSRLNISNSYKNGKLNAPVNVNPPPPPQQRRRGGKNLEGKRSVLIINISPLMGDLDDIFSFGIRCGDESEGMDSVVNIYISCVAALVFFTRKV